MAFSSNVLPGTIFLITLSVFLSRLSGGDVWGSTLKAAGELSEGLPSLLPRVMRVLLIVNGFGYFAAVLRSFFYRRRLTIKAANGILWVSGGTFTKYCQIFPAKAVESVCKRRGFLGFHYFCIGFLSAKRICLPVNPINIDGVRVKKHNILWLYRHNYLLKDRITKQVSK